MKLRINREKIKEIMKKKDITMVNIFNEINKDDYCISLMTISNLLNKDNDGRITTKRFLKIMEVVLKNEKEKYYLEDFIEEVA